MLLFFVQAHGFFLIIIQGFIILLYHQEIYLRFIVLV